MGAKAAKWEKRGRLKKEGGESSSQKKVLERGEKGAKRE